MPAPHPLLPPLTGSSKAFFINSPNEEHVWHPHPTLNNTIRVTLTSAGAGLVASAVQNALDKHNKGAFGIFTRTGGTIGHFAAMGFAYSFTTSYVSNLRQNDDALNNAAGGCAAGFIAGVRAKNLPLAVGACAGMATLFGTWAATGSALTGDGRMNLPRPEREARRLRLFERPEAAEETATAAA